MSYRAGHLIHKREVIGGVNSHQMHTLIFSFLKKRVDPATVAPL